MDKLIETIVLDTDESNELAFKIKIEGADNAPAKIRLVCESQDISYMFSGRTTKDVDVIQFTIPSMKNKIKEGLYSAKVEVLIENRYFSPVQFNINFKKSIVVVAESVSVKPTQNKQEVKVSASHISQKPKSIQPIVLAKTLKERYHCTKQIPKIDEISVRKIVRKLIKEQ